MKYFRRHQVPSFFAGSRREGHERRIPIAPPLAGAHVAAARTASTAFALFLLAAGLPSVSAAAQQFFCTFTTSPTDCGFIEQAKVPGRASIVPIGRDGTTSVRLHTEPGDNNVAGSGDMERDDLYLSVPGTADPLVFNQGEEHWWAHSILFPNDFAIPTWQMYVVSDFHHTGATGQANFQINFQAQLDTTQPGNLIFRGFGDVSRLIIGPSMG